MTARRQRRSGGNSLLEFTLVGIPLIFVLMSTFQMASAMWLYHTLAFAAKEGTRYAIVHGVNCSKNGNTYCIMVPDVATAINNSATGLNPEQMTVTLTPSQGSAITDTLANLMKDTAPYPGSMRGTYSCVHSKFAGLTVAGVLLRSYVDADLILA